jgi:hypothetical protein
MYIYIRVNYSEQLLSHVKVMQKKIFTTASYKLYLLYII